MNPLIPARDIVPRLLDRYHLGGQAQHIAEAWESEAGSLRAYTSIQGFRFGRLVVGVSSPSVQHELALKQHELIKRLNDRLGAAVIKQIHFTAA